MAAINKIQVVSKEILGQIAAKNGDTNLYESRDAGEMIFHFFDEVEEFSSGSSSCGSSSTGFDGKEGVYHEDVEEDDEAAAVDTAENSSKAEAAKAFWDSQEELLLSTLRRTTSFESKIRKATKEAIMELNAIGVNCVCQKRAVDGCRKCMRKGVCDRLQKGGFSCTICKSKWKSSQEIPAGEHTYVEVVQDTGPKRSEVKVIIELNFKSEFMMARGCEEYNRLLERLPDVYVGKTERLKTLIKILCSASKKCMKENKMHMAPWRKHKYMQAKWLGKPEKQPTLILPELHMEIRPSRPKASMLTFDFSDNLKILHPATMIKVL
ncbi:uncharacterized protein [Coffea arabica]|uniref:Uncharacterized protein n=1 Tax=Coffea arabica TaxID=13443 RepID=A0A6P6SA55_COFAR|nr:uncharacterized protein LOC113689506 [Coffea arabica]